MLFVEPYPHERNKQRWQLIQWSIHLEQERQRETESKQALNPTRMYVIPLKLPHQNSINTAVSGALEGLK
jgi:hypothetical protein